MHPCFHHPSRPLLKIDLFFELDVSCGCVKFLLRRYFLQQARGGAEDNLWTGACIGQSKDFEHLQPVGKDIVVDNAVFEVCIPGGKTTTCPFTKQGPCVDKLVHGCGVVADHKQWTPTACGKGCRQERARRAPDSADAHRFAREQLIEPTGEVLVRKQPIHQAAQRRRGVPYGRRTQTHS